MHRANHRKCILLLSFVCLAVTLITSTGCGGASGSTPTQVPQQAAQVTLSATSLDFGSVTDGKQASAALTVTNTKGSTATITQANVTNAIFGFTSAQTLPFSLSAGQSAVLNVTFSPTAPGAATGSLSVAVDGGASPPAVQLTGTGVATASGQLALTPASLSFGSVTVGTSQNLSGSLAATGSNITVSSGNLSGSGYTLSGITFPVTVAAGQSVPFTVTFAPQAAGGVTGSVTFASNASNSPDIEALSGSGVASSQFALNPASMNFGSVSLGGTQSQSGSLVATGSSITVSSANLSGTGYTLSGITLPVTIAAGQSVPFTVTFAPQTAGSATGSVTFASNASNSPDVEALSGSGLAGSQLAVSPASMNFGSILIGTSQSQSGSLTASGAANGPSVTVSSDSLSGAGYTLRGITLPVTVAVGQSVPFTITFDPQAGSSASGSLSFASNAANAPAVEALSGSGEHNVSLSWQVSPSTVVGYNVYRGTQTGGPYTKLTASSQAGTTYLDSGVLAGANYFYVVTSVDSSAQESAFSGEAMATVPAP